MECYIVRIYRQTEQGDIAGTLERVGESGRGRPFAGYRNLVETMQKDFLSGSSDAEILPDRPDKHLRVVHAVKHS